MERNGKSLLERSFDARAAAWSGWGRLETDVLSHAVNPSLTGGPRWPAMRQAYRVARKGKVVLVASDGLSDPYEDEDDDEVTGDENGVGLELFAATDDPVDRPDVRDPVRSVGATWLHDLVFQTSQIAAQHGTLGPMLDELGLVTLELWNVKIPETHHERFFNSAGRTTVLLSAGAAPIPTRIAGPLSPIRLVHVQLLTLAELGFVLSGGITARRELADRLRAQKVAPLSRLDRPSVA